MLSPLIGWLSVSPLAFPLLEFQGGGERAEKRKGGKGKERKKKKKGGYKKEESLWALEGGGF